MDHFRGVCTREVFLKKIHEDNTGIFQAMKKVHKTMEHSDHWIVTGRHGEQWDFQNNEKTMEDSYH